MPSGKVALGTLGRFARGNALALVALFVALGGTSVALTTTGSPATKKIFACENKRTGLLRISREEPHCTRFERLVVWNQQGPAGPAGETGSSGAEGATGPKG